MGLKDKSEWKIWEILKNEQLFYYKQHMDSNFGLIAPKFF